MTQGQTFSRGLSRVIAIVLGCMLPLAAATVAQGQEATGSPIEQKIIQSLSNLDGPKMDALYSHLGIEPSPDFRNCLCPGDQGYHYWGASEGDCRRIGVLGGVSFTGFSMDRFASCSAAYPLANGKTVVGAIVEAASPPKEDVCPARPGGAPTLADLRAASPFAYAAWPELFEDVPPDQVIYDLSPNDLANLRQIADGVAAIGDKIVSTTLEGAYTLADMMRVAPQAGYNVMTSTAVDVRLDFELLEIAFRYNPKSGRMEVSEYLAKYPVFGKGKNLEIAIGREGPTWDGKVKLGFSAEQDLPGLGQIEGKFGFEYNTGAVLTTSLDDEPVAVSPSRLNRLWSGLQSYLAGVDFYFGAAAAPGVSIGAHTIAVGPEATFAIKEAYSDAVFADMLSALDAVLVQQKAIEEKRHEMIRALATRIGVPNADCMTIGQTTRAIQQAIVEQAKAKGIPTEGRSIKDIRRDLGYRGVWR